MEDLLYIAKESSIKESWAKETIEQIIGVVSGFENRAKELKINDSLMFRVLKALRLQINKQDHY